VVSTEGGDLTLRTPALSQTDAQGRQASVPGRFVLHDNRTVTFEADDPDPALALTVDPVLAYSNLLGGFGNDQANALAVDGLGAMYVAGNTSSSNFPVTTGAYTTTYAGSQDAFVAKYDPSGSMVYATYLGGSNTDSGNAVGVDPAGYAYVA